MGTKKVVGMKLLKFSDREGLQQKLATKQLEKCEARTIGISANSSIQMGFLSVLNLIKHRDKIV